MLSWPKNTCGNCRQMTLKVSLYLTESYQAHHLARARFKGVLEGYQFESRGAERSGSEAATALLEAESRVFSNCATSTDRRLEWM